MNKLLLTTYRKLHKLCVAMDQRVEARAMLLCSPAEVYDHRSCTWRPVKLEKIVDWQDSRIFLDRLIRRLNNGKSYYIPPSSAEEAQRAEKQFVESLDALHAEQAAALIKENIAKKGGSKSVLTPQVMVPDFILPYMSLQKALRLSFEKNAFFTAHINNSMAAVKEMACALRLLTPQPLLPSEELLAGVPQLESAPCPSPMTHVTLFGLSEEMRGNFSARMEKNEIKFSRSEEKAEGEESVPKVGNEMQLLLAHPRLNGFFKCTVMLVVRHTPSESAAFVLNKPLLSNSLEPIDVRSVVTSTTTHPLFKKHLAGHTVMLGGPVMAGSPEHSLYLLHRIPGIPEAITLTDGLYLDGNADALAEKLETGAAKPEDIVVLCGLAGWSEGQLEGELRSGTWVVAKGAATEERVRDFPHRIANDAGSTAVPEEVARLVSAHEQRRRAQADKEPSVDEGEAGQTALGDEYYRNSTPVYGPQQLAWALAFSATGEALSPLGKSQS